MEEQPLSFSGRKNRHRQEQRRRILGTVLRVGIAAGVLGATAFYAYETGLHVAGAETAGLRADVDRLQALTQQRQDAVERLRLALDDAQRSAAQYRAMVSDAPIAPEARDLLRLVQAKLDSGLHKERLAQFIAAADRPKKCADAATKKFMARTSRSKAAETMSVRFDAVTVSAIGTAAVAGNGQAEHWYDPHKPVTVTFTEVGGKESAISGNLPLQHVLVIRNSEHRFTLNPGPRGFIEVTGDRCELLAG